MVTISMSEFEDLFPSSFFRARENPPVTAKAKHGAAARAKSRALPAHHFGHLPQWGCALERTDWSPARLCGPGPLRLKSSPVRTPLRSVCAAACGFTLDRAGLSAIRNAPHPRFSLRRIVATTRALAVRFGVESLPRRPRSVWMTAPLKPLIQIGEGQGRGWKGRKYSAHDTQKR